MAIGIECRCKINSNIGNPAITSNVDEELKKLHTSVHFGADTVMDLHRWRHSRFAKPSCATACAYRHRADLRGSPAREAHRRLPST